MNRTTQLQRIVVVLFFVLAKDFKGVHSRPLCQRENNRINKFNFFFTANFFFQSNWFIIKFTVIPIGSGKKREMVLEKADTLVTELKREEIRVKTDTREETPGWKFNEWEMRGVPIRVELGPRDLENNQVIIARRDTGEKITVAIDHLTETVKSLLNDIQTNVYNKALLFKSTHSHDHLDTLDELKQHIKKSEQEKVIAGWILAGWCGSEACEAKVKEETSFTSRNIPFEPPLNKETCITCGKKAQHTVWFSRAY